MRTRHRLADVTGSEENPRPTWRELLRTRTISSEVADTVPRGLRIAAAYGWRLIVVAAALGVVIWLVIQLRLLVIPLLIAILIAALLWPAFNWMLRHRVPRWLAIVVSVLGTIAIVTGLMYLAVGQIAREWPRVQMRGAGVVRDFREFLIEGPLHLTATQIDDTLKQAWEFIQQQVQVLISGAVAIGSTVGHVATGVLLAIFILLCVLADGRGIWRWVVGLFPHSARVAVNGAGAAGWRTIVNFARTQLIVATIDAVGIGLGAFLLGVPLDPDRRPRLPGIVHPDRRRGAHGRRGGADRVDVQRAVDCSVDARRRARRAADRGHVLQPLLMGAAVKVHPLAVVLVVAGGAMIAGIPGALFAVPLAAFVNRVAVYLSRREWQRGSPGEDPDLIWRTVTRERTAGS